MIARALTIAGSDSGGGAGIQQDLKTFHAHRVWGMTAITAVTVQNTVGVSGWTAMPPELVAAQIEAVASDIGVDAAKTGMLPSTAVVEAVARAVTDHAIAPLVVDPVMVATSGDALSLPETGAAIRDLLFPVATLLTPNAHEASVLAGIEVVSVDGQREAARAIVSLGARAVLVKGGHTAEGAAVDVLHDGREITELRAKRIETPNTHGTGCMLSASITAALAAGMSLVDAVARGKAFVTGGLRRSLSIGKGAGAVNPGWE